jgi:DNA repair protein SbcD/Mre11
MRILHTSDWHLGQNFYGKSRANEHQQFLTWLLAQVVEQQIDAIIVAGDLFDTGTPPSYARAMYYDFIVALHHQKCQLVLLAGNHDSVAMLGESKQVLARLTTQVVTHCSAELSNQLFVLHNRQAEPALLLCAIPFVRPRDVLISQAGQSATQKQQALQQAITAHYQQLFMQAEQLAAEKKLPIVMTGHLTTVGASSTDSVRDIYIGSLEAFPASAFPAADYIALGHIHQPQMVAKQAHIRYSGSPIPLSFDEAKQQKSVTIVELLPEQAAQISTRAIPQFQPMVMLKSSLDELAGKLAELATTAVGEQIIWLDIEISSSDYLTDLQLRVQALLTDLPFELLLLRRSKQARQQMQQTAEKITLDELSLQQVFESRLAMEDFSGTQGSERKQRLQHLFAELAEQLTQGS